MAGLSVSDLPRVLELPGGKRVSVRPPVVREAVILLGALAAGDAAVRDEVLDSWLPDEVRGLLELLGPVEYAQTLRPLIYDGSGIDPNVLDDKAGRRRAGPFDWRDAIAHYCMVYRESVWRVWAQTPFPFFLAMLAAADRASARELLRWANIEMLPHTGKDGYARILHDLEAAAKGEMRERDQRDVSPDVIEADQQRLREALGGLGVRVGEA